MAEQQSGLSEAAGVGTAVSDLLKLKRAAPFAKAVKGGVGGAAGAAIGMALGHKEEIKKSAGELRRIKQRHPDQREPTESKSGNRGGFNGVPR